MPTGAPLKPNADGSFTTGTPAAAAPPGNQAPAGTAPSDTPKPTAKASISLPKDAKDALSKLLTEQVKGLEDALAMVDGAKEVETPEEADFDALTSAMLDVAEALEDAAMTMTGVDPDADEPAEDGETPPVEGETPPPPGPTPTGKAEPFAKRFAVRAAKRVIAKAEVRKLAGDITSIAKAGRRMAKHRLIRLEQAVNILSSVFSELKPQVTAAVAAEKAKKAPPVPPGKDKGKDDKAKPPVEKRESAPAGVPVAVQKQLEELSTLVKSQGAELQRIKSNVSGSNAVPVEKSEQSAPAAVAWPTDMNQRFRREDVNKGLKPGEPSRHFGDD